MRVHCTNCGRDGHAKWQCTRPTKSRGVGEVQTPPAAPVELRASGANNPSLPKGSGVESLRTPTEGRKGRDNTSGGARAKLRDPSAVLTQTAAQPPVGTNSEFPSAEKGGGVKGIRSSEPVGLLTPNPQRLGGATRKDASPTAPNTNAGSPSQVRPPDHNGVIAGSNPAPATKFDKVAYQRVYMAKWRAEIKSGKRVPKRKGETT